MQPDVKNIGIITKKKIKEHRLLLEKTVDFLRHHEKKVYLDDNAAPLLNEGEGFSKKDILEKSDAVIILGGDGTILKTARHLSYHPVKILGVNLGRVGFLTEVAPERLEKAMETVLIQKKYWIDNRYMLRVTVYRRGEKIMTSLALNEVVINQGSFARLIDLKTEINQRKIAHFRADGLIIATPTGSTGHSLSAGGPIVHHDVDAFILNPICPASLANRSIVIPNDRQIKVVLETERKDHDTHNIGLTLDGQESFPLTYGDEIRIRKSARTIDFIRLGGAKYYKILRSKLQWGI